jgi:capsular polysaccharide biosynthesis protein
LRRSIPNLPDLYNALSPILNVELEVLEDVSLKDQIRLFSGADIVVAQHGASLANLVWCRQGALVMEIIDPQFRAPFYEALAHRLSLNYISIPQANNHAEIDIDSVASLILQKCSEEKNLL